MGLAGQNRRRCRRRAADRHPGSDPGRRSGPARPRSRTPSRRTTNSSLIGGLPADPVLGQSRSTDWTRTGCTPNACASCAPICASPGWQTMVEPPTVVAITSPSAEDGRTTLAVDLAATLAESGQERSSSSTATSAARHSPNASHSVGRHAKPPPRAGSAPRSPARPAWWRPSSRTSSSAITESRSYPPVHSRPGQGSCGPATGRRTCSTTSATPTTTSSSTPRRWSRSATARSSRRWRTARCWSPASAARRVPPCGARCRRFVEASATLIGTVATFEPGHRRQLNRSKAAGAPPKAPDPEPPAPDDTAKITTTDAETEGLVGSAGTQRIPRPEHGSG